MKIWIIFECKQNDEILSSQKSKLKVSSLKVGFGSYSVRRQSRSTILLLDCLLTEHDPRHTL